VNVKLGKEGNGDQSFHKLCFAVGMPLAGGKKQLAGV